MGQCEEKQRQIIHQLRQLPDPDSQCVYLMMLAMEHPCRLPVKKPAFRIGGCETAIWWRAWKEGNKVLVSGDSDSLLVRGVLVLFEAVYNRAKPEEAAVCPPELLQEISDFVIYPEVKQNGLLKCYQTVISL